MLAYSISNYNETSIVFLTFVKLAEDSLLSTGSITTDMDVDSEGRIFFLTFENRIIIVDETQWKWLIEPDPDSVYHYKCISVDENDVLWIGTRSGYIVRVDESGQAFFSTLVYTMHTSQIGNINGHSGTGTTAVLNGDGIWRLIKMA